MSETTDTTTAGVELVRKVCERLDVLPGAIRTIEVRPYAIIVEVYALNDDGAKWVDRGSGTVALDKRTIPFTYPENGGGKDAG